MSSFSANWLRLREAADLRARNRAVAAALERHFAASSGVKVVDLGCGTGANLRALRAYLPNPQIWRLVDHDPALLAAAHAATADFAGNPIAAAVSFVLADLAADIAPVLADDSDLVTAAAFFDLVSANWIECFATTLADRRIALHAALIYDGNETWTPAHPADDDILAAFHVHQGGDKGFGPAAGPKAAAQLAAALRRRGYHTELGRSPWRLGAADQELVGELARGIATAAAETGLVSQDKAASWGTARRRPGVVCEIGHVDLFAFPPPGLMAGDGTKAPANRSAQLRRPGNMRDKTRSRSAKP